MQLEWATAVAEPPENWLRRGLKAIGPLRKLVRLLKRTRDRYRISVWTLSGLEHVTQQPISVFYSGQIENCNYLARVVFGDGRYASAPRRMWIGSVMRLLTKPTSPYSLIFLQLDRLPSHLAATQRYFVIPSWAAGEIDVARALERCKTNASIKTDLRHIRRNGLTYRTTVDSDEIERFYATMYLPTVKQAHSDCAFVTTLEELKREAGSLQLLLVEQNGDPIAGVCLGTRDRRRLDALELGVANGNRELLKLGALAATYYYTLLYASENAYPTVYLGGARAFLRDGPLQYKRKWGLSITGRLPSMPELFVFQPRLASPATAAFLVNNPFIYQDGDVFRGAVFLDGDSARDGDVAELPKTYGIGGLRGVSVFRIDRASGTLQADERNVR